MRGARKRKGSVRLVRIFTSKEFVRRTVVIRSQYTVETDLGDDSTTCVAVLFVHGRVLWAGVSISGAYALYFSSSFNFHRQSTLSFPRRIPIEMLVFRMKIDFLRIRASRVYNVQTTWNYSETSLLTDTSQKRTLLKSLAKNTRNKVYNLRIADIFNSGHLKPVPKLKLLPINNGHTAKSVRYICFLYGFFP